MSFRAIQQQIVARSVEDRTPNTNLLVRGIIREAMRHQLLNSA